MINVTVKTLWNGQVAIPEKYTNEALKSATDLCIHHAGKQMIIPASEVQSRIRGRSASSFKDKFSNNTYRLVYIVWRPEPEVQQKLI